MIPCMIQKFMVKNNRRILIIDILNKCNKNIKRNNILSKVFKMEHIINIGVYVIMRNVDEIQTNISFTITHPTKSGSSIGCRDLGG